MVNLKFSKKNRQKSKLKMSKITNVVIGRKIQEKFENFLLRFVGRVAF